MASGRAQSPVRHATPDAELFEGSFAPAGTGAPTTLRGAGFTVARVSAGRWTVTLPGLSFSEDVKIVVGVRFNTAPTNVYDIGVIGGVTNANGAVSFDILYRENAVATDIAANANNRVSFSLTVKP